MGRKIWRILMAACRWCLAAPLAWFRIELSDKLWGTVEQFIKFAGVGCSNAGISLAVYYVTISLLGEPVYLLGQTLGYAAGVVNSYFWNSKIVFRTPKATGPWGAFIRMCMCYGVTYVMQMGIVYAGVEMLHISEMVVPVIAILITTPVNFLLNRSFAFRNRMQEK